MSFFSPNIGTLGRIVRGICGLVCLGGGGVIHKKTVLAIVLLGSGLFTLFEAARGWCVARACGIKTPL